MRYVHVEITATWTYKETLKENLFSIAVSHLNWLFGIYLVYRYFTRRAQCIEEDWGSFGTIRSSQLQESQYSIDRGMKPELDTRRMEI